VVKTLNAHIHAYSFLAYKMNDFNGKVDYKKVFSKKNIRNHSVWVAAEAFMFFVSKNIKPQLTGPKLLWVTMLWV